MSEISLKRKFFKYKFGFFGYPDKPVVSLIYQYHYDKSFKRSVYTACPPSFDQKNEDRYPEFF